jgi:uroporphyrin-3 C-methyltransferase
MSEEIDITQPPVPRTANRATQVALVLAVIAISASAWQWLDQRQREKALEQTLTQRLSQFEQRNSESLVLARLAEENTAKAAAKIALLEQRLDESRSQQEALQTLYLELANNRDERTISEVEQLVIIASQQLQLAGSVKPALLALQTADSRLQQLDKPQVIALRKVIGNDIQRLQALPGVDVVGMSLKLEALVDAADKLPLASERHPATKIPILPDWDSNPWRRLVQEVWQDIKHMVRIERIDQPEVPLLAPEQTYFLRENLKLRLLATRISLLQHDETTYRTDLHTVEVWLKNHFDTRDAATQNALATLQQLLSSDISLQLPDISESLNAVAKYKLSLERGKP